MGYCEDPCQLHEACASSAICKVKMHRPICTCPEGHEGNPAFNCTTRSLSKKTLSNYFYKQNTIKKHAKYGNNLNEQISFCFSMNCTLL